MATLVLSTVGSAIGGPIGGTIGAAVGQQIDQNILFKPKGREGPRLQELAVQTSSYGSQIPRVFGRMRVAGTVIWATELKESKSTEGGKGRPSTTTYSYSACFAVALSSRNIKNIGRIWADGKIFRGAAGDFKTPTGFQFHGGHEDQPADGLINAAEETGNTPAYRGTAIAVFEDMDLTDYGNRIPSLTFEIIADDGSVSLSDIVGDISRNRISFPSGETLHGYAASGQDRRASLTPLVENYLLSFSANNEKIAAYSRLSGTDQLPFDLEKDIVRDFAGTRADLPESQTLPETRYPSQLSIRYYEPERDYQSGMQNAFRPGHGRAIEDRELPAAVSANAAKSIAGASLWTGFGERHSLKAHILHDSRPVIPGAFVQISGGNGIWRVRGWELKSGAIELIATSIVHTRAGSIAETDQGRSLPDNDLAAGVTRLVLADLPFAVDAPRQASASGQLYAAAAGGLGWRNADLYAATVDGSPGPLVGQISVPATIGTADQPLAAGSALIIDNKNTIDVTLHNQTMVLHGADQVQLLSGSNVAALGSEIIQFADASPLGNNRYRLSGLIRGLGGTEHHMDQHAAGENFLLIEPALMTAIDPQYYALFKPSEFLALGRDDNDLVRAVAGNPGMALLPWSPVHERFIKHPGGDMEIIWTRRSREGSVWLDGVEVPIGEESEQYSIQIENDHGDIVDIADSVMPNYRILASKIDQYRSGGIAQLNISIRQVGQFGVSEPATLHLPI